ncbi:MAG TPA: hypothetical protein VHJ99_08995 [Candidatus Dormibacteraeota bacterium]|nr:hypothetical protein [Candidatus Dormibacteraeota bacterium]
MQFSPRRALIVVASTAAGLLVTVACGSPTGTTAGTDAAPATAGAEVNTGEGIPVPYSDTRFHYRIDGPGHMTANPDGTAAYVGPSERIEISVVQGSRASDPAAMASQDLKSLATSAAAFRQISSPAKLTLGGYQVTRFAFTWNAGTSTVTGKAIELTSVRYYVSKDATTLAVITYGIVSNQFDPQGADDIVSTFKWQ